MNFYISNFFILFLIVNLTGCLESMITKPKMSDIFTDVRLQKLLRAAKKGDKSKVESFISAHVNINTEGKDGITPLHWFLLKQDKLGFEILLKVGADPNVNPKTEQNVIVTAAAIENLDYLSLLLQYGGNPNIIAAGNQTPLMKCANNVRIKAIDLLLQHGANINQQVFDGTTALLSSAMQDEYEAVLYLLHKGADFLIPQNTGGTVAYLVHVSNLAKGTRRYDYKEKVRDFLISKGVFFPPDTPVEIRKRYGLL